MWSLSTGLYIKTTSRVFLVEQFRRLKSLKSLLSLDRQQFQYNSHHGQPSKTINVDWCCTYKKDDSKPSSQSLCYQMRFLVYGSPYWNFLSHALEKDLLSCWRTGFTGHQSVDIWNAIPLCPMWCIWKEWNFRFLKG